MKISYAGSPQLVLPLQLLPTCDRHRNRLTLYGAEVEVVFMAIGAESTPLSRERVLHAAVRLADTRGIDALTMRNLAEALGVEAMSLYYHVANKSALLDGVAEVVMGEIEHAVARLDAAPDWKSVMRERILTAREVLLRHPWAPAIVETRSTPNPALLRYLDGLLGLFRQGGFSVDLAHHALHTLGSRALGFVQEVFAPGGGTDQAEADEMLARLAGRLPNLMEMMAQIAHDQPDSTLGYCDDQAEFEFALDLILDGLERRAKP